MTLFNVGFLAVAVVWLVTPTWQRGRSFGQACRKCRQRPAIRTDGLCAPCGLDKDTA